MYHPILTVWNFNGKYTTRRPEFQILIHSIRNTEVVALSEYDKLKFHLNIKEPSIIMDETWAVNVDTWDNYFEFRWRSSPPLQNPMIGINS